jgi:hypothetical protein
VAYFEKSSEILLKERVAKLIVPALSTQFLVYYTISF